MSLLSYTRLLELVTQGVITNVTPDMVNGSSIDVTLGLSILIEKVPSNANNDYTINPAIREPLHLQQVSLEEEHYWMYPGEFVLAHTMQRFYLPLNMSAEYRLKSSIGRSGLEHLNAGWCDPGWHNSVLTLELKNMTRYHTLKLTKGMPIGQVTFYTHEAVPFEHSYAMRGSYNGDKTVSPAKQSSFEFHEPWRSS